MQQRLAWVLDSVWKRILCVPSGNEILWSGACPDSSKLRLHLMWRISRIALPHANIIRKGLLNSQIWRFGNRLLSWITKLAMLFGRMALWTFFRKLAFNKHFPRNKVLCFRLLDVSKEHHHQETQGNSFGLKITGIKSFLVLPSDLSAYVFYVSISSNTLRFLKNRTWIFHLHTFCP